MSMVMRAVVIYCCYASFVVLLFAVPYILQWRVQLQVFEYRRIET